MSDTLLTQLNFTAGTTLLTVVALLLFGGEVLRGFAFALFVSATVNIFWFVPWKYLENFSFSVQNAIRTLKKSSQYAILITTSFGLPLPKTEKL